MINLQYLNKDVFVFNTKDWATLRKTHRIIGQILGTTTFIPSLPCKLSPEEVLLLTDGNLAQVVESKHDPPTEEIEQNYANFEKELTAEQQVLHKRKRRIQVEAMIDRIVAGKRRKGDQRSSEEILEEEVGKSSTIPPESIIWPTLLTPIKDADILRTVPREEIAEKTTELKYRVFKDLWDKGYCITLGHKFGGDFLVYLGDPIIYHAIFIIKCLESPDSPLHSSEIVAFGRLGTSVKKRAVLASIDHNDKLSYITINWIDAYFERFIELLPMTVTK